jgi:hypothetical protein
MKRWLLAPAVLASLVAAPAATAAAAPVDAVMSAVPVAGDLVSSAQSSLGSVIPMVTNVAGGLPLVGGAVSGVAGLAHRLPGVSALLPGPDSQAGSGLLGGGLADGLLGTLTSLLGRLLGGAMPIGG